MDDEQYLAHIERHRAITAVKHRLDGTQFAWTSLKAGAPLKSLLEDELITGPALEKIRGQVMQWVQDDLERVAAEWAAL